jgi:beta-glucosidase/6-phospho-beta-glucosidase/beta-galactosidase
MNDEHTNRRTRLSRRLSMGFGIFHVDFASQLRIIKQSSQWYVQVTRQNGFVPGA